MNKDEFNRKANVNFAFQIEKVSKELKNLTEELESLVINFYNFKEEVLKDYNKFEDKKIYI